MARSAAEPSARPRRWLGYPPPGPAFGLTARPTFAALFRPEEAPRQRR